MEFNEVITQRKTSREWTKRLTLRQSKESSKPV